ncbi:hypothetical protein BCR44DRAFT_29641 [Catenaria anguillulae PL171]|uniref:Uncharacterized protein n=1 Tax=Catenaria anguillulae PL171 TaxID=765915 RepID=A0A1Y2I169_9FUNG|nr:hypothetical protein BCR44DRAFT_29641 [Catenaria anguillulae PL171]
MRRLFKECPFAVPSSCLPIDGNDGHDYAFVHRDIIECMDWLAGQVHLAGDITPPAEARVVYSKLHTGMRGPMHKRSVERMIYNKRALWPIYISLPNHSSADHSKPNLRAMVLLGYLVQADQFDRHQQRYLPQEALFSNHVIAKKEVTVTKLDSLRRDHQSDLIELQRALAVINWRLHTIRCAADDNHADRDDAGVAVAICCGLAVDAEIPDQVDGAIQDFLKRSVEHVELDHRKELASSLKLPDTFTQDIKLVSPGNGPLFGDNFAEQLGEWRADRRDGALIAAARHGAAHSPTSPAPVVEPMWPPGMMGGNIGACASKWRKRCGLSAAQWMGRGATWDFMRASPRMSPTVPFNASEEDVKLIDEPLAGLLDKGTIEECLLADVHLSINLFVVVQPSGTTGPARGRHVRVGEQSPLREVLDNGPGSAGGGDRRICATTLATSGRLHVSSASIHPSCGGSDSGDEGAGAGLSDAGMGVSDMDSVAA